MSMTLKIEKLYAVKKKSFILHINNNVPTRTYLKYIFAREI